MIEAERTERLQVLWKKGRNFYQSFFAELGSVHAEFGSDAEFAKWCIWELGIGVDIITKVADVLRKVDAAIAKKELARAREIALAEKRQRVQEEKQRREAEATARETERTRKAAEKKEQEQRRKKQENDRRYRRRKKEQQQAAYASVATDATIGGELQKSEETRFPNARKTEFPNDTDRAAAIKAAQRRVDSGRDEWIEGSVELGALLRQERAIHESNNDFGAWLDRHKIDISKNDRAALINLASDLEAFRKTLASTDRSSYQLIWADVKKQIEARISS